MRRYFFNFSLKTISSDVSSATMSVSYGNNAIDLKTFLVLLRLSPVDKNINNNTNDIAEQRRREPSRQRDLYRTPRKQSDGVRGTSATADGAAELLPRRQDNDRSAAAEISPLTPPDPARTGRPSAVITGARGLVDYHGGGRAAAAASVASVVRRRLRSHQPRARIRLSAALDGLPPTSVASAAAEEIRSPCRRRDAPGHHAPADDVDDDDRGHRGHRDASTAADAAAVVTVAGHLLVRLVLRPGRLAAAADTRRRATAAARRRPAAARHRPTADRRPTTDHRSTADDRPTAAALRLAAGHLPPAGTTTAHAGFCTYAATCM